MRTIVAAALAALAMLAADAAGQSPGIRRQVLERSVSAGGERDVLLVRVEIAP